jgi:hypothetical protein
VKLCVDKTLKDKDPYNGDVLRSTKYWKPGQTLRVRFLNGDEIMKKNVEHAARLWQQYANITFDFGTNNNTELRIGLVSYSLTKQPR